MPALTRARLRAGLLTLLCGALILEVGPQSVNAAPASQIQCPRLFSRCDAQVRFGLAYTSATTLTDQSGDTAAQLGHANDLPSWFENFTAPLLSQKNLTKFSSRQLPIVTWEPTLVGAAASTDVLDAIVAGRFDNYLKKSAANVAALNRPIIIRFAHEMNGYWYPWGLPKGGDPRSKAFASHTTALFIAAYRRVVSVMKANGASQALWMWSPNLIDATPAIPLASLYPGDDVVDLLGVSAYILTEGTTLWQRFASTYAQLVAISPSKPIIIAETSVGKLADRATATRQLLATAARIPSVVGVVWLNAIDRGLDLRLLESDGSLEAARVGLLAAPYVRETGPFYASVALAQIKGMTLLGQTLTADWRVQGVAKSVQVMWSACDQPTGAASCRVVRSGRDLPLSPNLWHTCVRAAVSVRSLLGRDSVVGDCSSKILSVPPAPEISVIDIRGTSLRVALPTMDSMSDHFVIRLDSGTKVYMSAVTTEYWFNNLTQGIPHTISIAFSDLTSVGSEVSLTLATIAKPPSAVVSAVNGVVTAQLPAVVTGQTGWVVQLDAETPESLDTSLNTWVRAVTPGAHTFSLRRKSGIGTTNPAVTTFTAKS